MNADDSDMATRQKIRRQGGIGVHKPTSAVDQAVAARIERARQREADAKRRRTELKEARDAGLRRRHAAKLAYLDAQEAAEELRPPTLETRTGAEGSPGAPTPREALRSGIPGDAPGGDR